MNKLMTMIAMQSADLVAGSQILVLMMAAAYCFTWGHPRWLWLLVAVAVLMIAANIAADQWGMPVPVQVHGNVEWEWK